MTMNAMEPGSESRKLNRRWLQFGLRTALAVVTLIAVCLGARVEYLRRYAAFHDHKAEMYLEQIERECGPILARHGVFDDFQSLKTTQERIDFIGNLRWNAAGEDPEEVALFSNHTIRLMNHHFLAAAYRRTSYAPWMLVDMHLPSDAQPPKR